MLCLRMEDGKAVVDDYGCVEKVLGTHHKEQDEDLIVFSCENGEAVVKFKKASCQNTEPSLRSALATRNKFAGMLLKCFFIIYCTKLMQ